LIDETTQWAKSPKKQSEGVQVVCLWYLSYLIIC